MGTIFDFELATGPSSHQKGLDATDRKNIGTAKSWDTGWFWMCNDDNDIYGRHIASRMATVLQSSS